jgi:hypothetical protein
MRKLTDHIVEGDSANHQLSVIVEDDPGAGGACHRYTIEGFNASTNMAWDHRSKTAPTVEVLLFQNGPIGEVGVNGVTHEALLAVLIDRLRSFQAGPYAGRENALALTHLEEALMWLQHRTRMRIKRGVEGTHTR